MDLKYILEVLFPYIVILYLIDCITYVKSHHLLFVSDLGKGFRLKEAGLHLVGLLPVSQTIASHNLPLCFTSNGVHTVADGHQYKSGLYEAKDFHFIPYHDLITIETDGKAVKINGKVSIKTPSGVIARHIMGLIQDLKGLRPSKRRKKIQSFLTKATDLQEIETLRTAYSNPILYLKILSSVLFTYTFIVLPLALYSELYLHINFFGLLVSMALNYLLIIILAYFAHQKIYRAKFRHRVYSLISIILSPFTAVHVLNNLTRDIYARFDHLAVAAELLPSSAFQDLMRKELYRITYTKARNENSPLVEFWNLRENSLHALLAKVGISTQKLLVAPKKQDESATSYCPLCGAEYMTEFDRCSDCGVELKEFE